MREDGELTVRFAMIADHANISQEGKLNVCGQFNVIWAQEDGPVLWPLMFVVARLEASTAHGRHHSIGLRILDDDGNLVVPPIDGRLDLGANFRPGFPHAGVFILGIHNALFPRPGTYTVELVGDGSVLERLELHVLLRQAPTR